jgi:hypothetical protein
VTVSISREPLLRWRLAIWMVGSAIGVAVLALPDTEPRIVSLSNDHGPTALDAVGIVILVGAWLPIAWLLWTERSWCATAAGRACGALAVVGVVLLAVTIAFDLGPGWVAAVVLLVAAQAWALTGVAREVSSQRTRGTSRG